MNDQGVPGKSYGLALALTILLSVLYIINKTTIGHTLIYYGLLLLILLTLVTQAQFISSALAPLSRRSN